MHVSSKKPGFDPDALLAPTMTGPVASRRTPPKFSKPKILLIGSESVAATPLSEAGYNVAVGWFGRPFHRTEPNALAACYHLPNHTEQEIVVIDLCYPPLRDAGSLDEWSDPRLKVMAEIRPDFDRIYNFGGVFVVFCEPRIAWDRQSGLVATSPDDSFDDDENERPDTWGFLSVLSSKFLDVWRDHGMEMTCVGKQTALTSLLSRHLSGAQFFATLRPHHELGPDRLGPEGKEPFIPVLKSKYGDTVGGVICNEQTGGLVFLLPYIADKPGFIYSLIT